VSASGLHLGAPVGGVKENVGIFLSAFLYPFDGKVVNPRRALHPGESAGMVNVGAGGDIDYTGPEKYRLIDTSVRRRRDLTRRHRPVFQDCETAQRVTPALPAAWLRTVGIVPLRRQ
jgi:hypothetical protein